MSFLKTVCLLLFGSIFIFAGAQPPPAGNQQFTPVTIKQLREDPKGFAQKHVAVRGQISEVSRADQAFELLQGAESLHVLIGGLPEGVQETIYSAKPGSRVTAYGEFSGYVLFAAKVKLGK